MNVMTSRANGVLVMRVNEPRMTFPIIGDFATTVAGHIAQGETKVLVDLTAVNYVDSATIGCLMDLYRQASAAGGAFKLAGVQKRVETMLSMTGAQNFLEVHPDQQSALASFGG
jgi:anti-anti-sigma factor